MPTPELLEQARKANEARAARKASKSEEIETRRLTNQIKLNTLCEQNDWTVGIDVAVVSTKTGDMVVVKKPGPAVFQAFSQKVLTSKAGPADYYTFVKPCVVYPSVDEFVRLSDTHPGLVLKCAELAGELASAEAEDLKGK